MKLSDLTSSVVSVGPRRRGVAALYAVLIFAVILGIAALAVDFGRVVCAKGELQGAADAAARAGAAGLGTSTTQANSSAKQTASANTCVGTAVTLLDQDIEYGTWDAGSQTFTVLTGGAASSADAVRITARRVAARSTGVPLLFLGIVGKNDFDLTAVAIARGTHSAPGGFIGLGSITTKNSTFLGSYDTSSTTTPTEATAGANGAMGSNGPITSQNNDTINGDVYLGPSGSISGDPTVTGQTQTLSSAIPTPSTPAWAPTANPNGLPQNYTVNSSTTLPGGTYWFTSLTVNADLTFSGAATVIVDGNIVVDANFRAFNRLPANLKIYQLGTGRTFGDASSSGKEIIATIIAPGSDCTFKNHGTMLGSAVFNSITMKNSYDFFYDEALGPASGKVAITLVH
jgi:hypothetical protein